VYRTGELWAQVNSAPTKIRGVPGWHHVQDRNGASFHAHGVRCPHYRIVYVCDPCPGGDCNGDVHVEVTGAGESSDDSVGAA
jgi:hypothetical protein